MSFPVTSAPRPTEKRQILASTPPQPHNIASCTNTLNNRPQSNYTAETKTGQVEETKQAKNHHEAKTTTRNATLLHQTKKKKSILASTKKQDNFARPMLTYSYPVDGDVPPGLSTRRSSGYVKGEIDSYAKQRVGTKPLDPQFILVNCGKESIWIAELAAKDTTNTMHEIFSGFTKDVVNAEKKRFCQEQPSKNLKSVLNSIVKEDYNGLPNKISRLKWFSLEQYNAMIGKNGDKNKNHTLFGKTPSKARYKSQVEPQTVQISRIKEISKQICGVNSGIDILPITNIKKNELKILKTSSLRSDLKGALANLYSRDVTTMSSAILADVRELHKDIAVEAVMVMDTMQPAAKRSKLDPQTKQNITFIERQKLSNWKTKFAEHEQRLQQTDKTPLNVLIQCITEGGAFYEACGDYILSEDDIQNRLKTNSIGACQYTVNSLKESVDKIENALLLLSVTTLQASVTSSFARKMIESQGTIRKIKRAVMVIANKLTLVKTENSVSLQFRNVCNLHDSLTLKRWTDVIQPRLKQLVAANPRSASDSGLEECWGEILGKNNPLDVSNKKRRKKWYDGEKQGEMLNGLKWIWLIWHCHVNRDGTAEDFVRDLYGTPHGEAICLVFLAWKGAIIKRVKDEANSNETTFVCPPGFSGNAPVPVEKEPMELSGPVLSLAVDLFLSLGDQIGSSDSLSLEAKARWIQCWGIWRLVERFGNRSHMLQEICFCTTAEWNALDQKYWNEQEMRNGFFIVIDHYANKTIRNLVIHIFDCKVPDSTPISIDICFNGDWKNKTDKSLFSKVFASYTHLHPLPRSYTTNIEKNGKFLELSVYVWSTPGMQEFHPDFSTFSQDGPRKKYEALKADNFKNKLIMKKKGKYIKDKHGNYVYFPTQVAQTKTIMFSTQVRDGKITNATRYPPPPSKYAHTGSMKKADNGTKDFLENAMTATLAQIKAGDQMIMRSAMYSNVLTKTDDEIAALPKKDKKGKKTNWQLKQHANLKKDPSYALPTQPLNSVGLSRQSGGTFTAKNMITLSLLGQAVRDEEVVCKLKFAGRYVNQSYIMSAKELFVAMGVRDTGDPLLYQFIRNDLDELRSIEGHDGANSDKTAKHYHGFFEKTYDLCEISERTLKHAPQRLAAYEIKYSYTDGIIEFPMDLVEASEYDASVDVWERCNDPKKLNIGEQLQQLDYLQRWKSVLTILHKYDVELRDLPVMKTFVYPKITLVLGYDPRIASAREDVASL